jgi:anhydro-N-acetylmuramic acid kinase
MPEKFDLTVAGLMSGTSLDGVDIALCRFSGTGQNWSYSVTSAITVPYTNSWKQKLIAAENCGGLDLLLLHKEYGDFLGVITRKFLQDQAVKPDFISSHGHTIFHQPEKRLTFQMGDGACIAAQTGVSTICDFRNLDVVAGGQGAPLVPIGDELLFSEYDQCLNLGGFANISYNEQGIRKAYDICPVNIILNHLVSRWFKKDYDQGGEIGRKGAVNNNLLEKLNGLLFFTQKPPKSLGKEWVMENMHPLTIGLSISYHDCIRTIYENIAIQLAKEVNAIPGDKILITGGGAYNTFLLELLKSKTGKNIILPDPLVIDYKEALIFAFLGVLRYLNKPNCLASVTGAPHDSSGGIIHYQF